MAKRKSPAKPGSQIPFRLKDDEYQEVLDWINAQDIVSDSIRFLIQMDVARNGGNAVNYQEEIIKNQISYEKVFIGSYRRLRLHGL